MTKTRKPKERNTIDQMLDQVNLKGLSRGEVFGQDCLLKQLTGKFLSKILEAEMDERLSTRNTLARVSIPATARTSVVKRQY
jgi:hypothetical protein